MVLNAWIGRTSYWKPPILMTSGWVEHAPFAYWLMDTLRPKRVVELGTHTGYSFFVFCEAVKRLGIPDATVFALDSWEGDVHAGFYGEDVFEAVTATVRERYPDIGRLMRGYFDDSRPAFEAGSIDLLHLDGRHLYEDVRHDFETWVDALSPTGVVLFHDTTVRRDDFGVWKFWEEIRERYPSIGFEHGNGLGVLAPHQDVPALSGFFEAARTQGDAIRADYAKLGAELTESADLAGRLEAAEARASSAESAVREASQEAASLDRKSVV